MLEMLDGQLALSLACWLGQIPAWLSAQTTAGFEKLHSATRWKVERGASVLALPLALRSSVAHCTSERVEPGYPREQAQVCCHKRLKCAQNR